MLISSGNGKVLYGFCLFRIPFTVLISFQTVHVSVVLWAGWVAFDGSHLTLLGILKMTWFHPSKPKRKNWLVKDLWALKRGYSR